MATTTTKRDTGRRSELVRLGVAILTEKGFYNFSLDELVALAGVPKGSFHYYFNSKDAYGLEVIQAYSDYFVKKLDLHLTDTSLSPLERIKAFTEDASKGMQRHKFKRGCLVGNLSQELAALDENFRTKLLEVLQEWRDRIQVCLEEGKQVGEIREDADTAALSRYFWNAWEGAVMCSKLEKSRRPLDDASAAFLAHVAWPNQTQAS
ncbi:acrylate utilization transcriptional regulator AcuR [Paraburkholderia metrosideri]|jgi:TetR/AcrR family transcriptional repressor of nem operon|uniref:Transcriptional regulator AcuR n=1 Tax=Paraburkholderia metrosideri TaxID=580937 RepID=A0ABN7I6R0_9BURK|nr:TetR/AcrR family transcriptional regulator [Paraburkholderia metrosideri]CAD6548121.1 Transcriptional regulator AcuR [Paraburkholderia metrosideri]